MFRRGPLLLCSRGGGGGWFEVHYMSIHRTEVGIIRGGG